MWPKSTLDGVRSAITSRKLMSSKMRFEFQRAGSNISATSVSEEFEIKVSRPMGINVEGMSICLPIGMFSDHSVFRSIT